MKRDYLRTLITKINRVMGIVFNASKLYSTKQCEEYILEVIKKLVEEKNKIKLENIKLSKEKAILIDKIKKSEQLNKELEATNSKLLYENINLKNENEKLKQGYLVNILSSENKKITLNQIKNIVFIISALCLIVYLMTILYTSIAK